MTSNHLIKRPSLGQKAYLGSLYDARKEVFIDKNAFDKDLNPELLILEEQDSIEFEANRVKNQLDRFKSLGIEGEPVLSVLSGLVQVSGSARYLTEEPLNDGTLSYNIVERVRTLNERLKWEETGGKVRTLAERIDKEEVDLLDYISKKALEEETATHLVVGIEWGANLVVSLDFEESDLHENEEKLESKIHEIKDSLISGNFTKIDVDLGKKLSIQVYNDDESASIASPRTLNGALLSLQETAKLSSNITGNKGVQIGYELLDLRHLVQKYKIPAEIKSNHKELLKKQVDRLSTVLADARQQFKKLSHLRTLASQSTSAVSAESLKAFSEYFDACRGNFEKLEKKAKKHLALARDYDEESRDKIGELPSKEFNNWTTKKGIEAFEKRFGSTIRAIKFYNDLAGYGIVFVKAQDEYNRLKDTCTGRFFALFYTLEQIEDKEKWTANVDQFKRLVASKEDIDMHVAVNVDELPYLHLQENLPKGMRIIMAAQKRYLFTDLCAHIELLRKTNYVMSQGEMRPSNRQPLDLVRASIPCPNGGCCQESREGKTWICQACNKELEYDLDHRFYCECGTSDIINYKFRCSSDRHGDEFMAYDAAKLRRALAPLKPYEKINILVIGQTGIGKSTWINATATYITHKTLEEAAASEFSYLIPFQFTTTTVTKTGNEVISIKIGESKNEVYEEKKSVTQFPKAHYFKNNDQKRVYCIVDTPGVGDCQGIERDKENMQNIVNFIGKLGKINLICFLLPPNEARLDPIFEFCFKELIMQFHRSAIHNIAFCFTKASGCGFKVSETIVPLRLLVNEIKEKQGIEIVLNQSSLFVFDNIAYRYLAELHKTGIPEQDQTLLDLNARSYEVSAKQTQKMLDQALHTPPHRVEDTLHLNYSRRIINKLAPSLTMIGTTVSQTINEINTVQKDADRFRGCESEMLQVLKRTVKIYRYKALLKTNVYCRKCAVYTEYSGAERDKFIEADPSLAKNDPVVMLTGGKAKEVDGKYECKTCGFVFDPIKTCKTYSKIYEDREEIDEDVQFKLNRAQDDFEKCQILIRQKQQRKEELELEIREIRKASAKFAVFLKENSITAYNDITEQYLLQLMDLEEKHGGIGGEKHRALSRMLDDHKEEISIIEQTINQANQLGLERKITADEVMRTAEELKTLKHYGNDIYQALEGVKQWVATTGDEDPPSVYNPSHRRLRKPIWTSFFSRFF